MESSSCCAFWSGITRWAARITAAALALMIAAFAIGEGAPNPFRASPTELAQHAAFLAVLVGLIAGFRWEALGGAVVLLGLSSFYLINFSASGRWPGGAFPLFAIPGVLYLATAAVSCKKSEPKLA
jgi:hypothetical protein